MPRIDMTLNIQSRFILITSLIGLSLVSASLLPEYLKLASLLFLCPLFTQIKPVWYALSLREEHV